MTCVGGEGMASETLPVMVQSKISKLWVNHSRTVEEWRELGGYYWTTAAATSQHLRLEGSGIVEYEVCRFSFGVRIHAHKVESMITDRDHSRPWQPASAAPLLAFGVAYRTEQLIRPVVGLNAWVELASGAFYVYLHKTTIAHPTVRGVELPKRTLHLQQRTFDWPEGTSFLAVRRAA